MSKRNVSLMMIVLLVGLFSFGTVVADGKDAEKKQKDKKQK